MIFAKLVSGLWSFGSRCVVMRVILMKLPPLDSYSITKSVVTLYFSRLDTLLATTINS